MKVSILLTYGKLWHDLIISLKTGRFWSIKLVPPATLYRNALPIQESDWLCICV